MKIDNYHPIKILFLAAEAYPLIKIGGLGDYAGSLPRAIINQSRKLSIQTDFRVVIPFHKQINLPLTKLNKITDVSVPSKSGVTSGSVYGFFYEGINYYLIKRHGNASGYQSVYNESQKDDAKKFIFFSLACINLIKQIEWKPDIVHANDWHTALALKQLSILTRSDSFYHTIKSLLVIHNLPFFGAGSDDEIQRYNISPSKSDLFPLWAKSLPLPMGLEVADKIVTVSPSYAKELENEIFSYGLAPFFVAHHEKTTGILNGIDYDIWDPEKDEKITVNFSLNNIEIRKKNKVDLLKKQNLQSTKDFPLLILISRLTYQKGIDLILDGLPQLLKDNWNAIFLGTGQKEYEDGLKTFASQFPNRFRFFAEYNDKLAHQLYASGDIILMPSLYEPCGLSQMIAMRYGCIPVARAVGGLSDSIISKGDKKDGYLFNNADARSFADCLGHALDDYKNPSKWKAIQSRAMRKNFSWEKSAMRYLRLYKKMIS